MAQIRQLFHMCRSSGTDRPGQNSEGPDQTAFSHVLEQWNRQAWETMKAQSDSSFTCAGGVEQTGLGK